MRGAAGEFPGGEIAVSASFLLQFLARRLIEKCGVGGEGDLKHEIKRNREVGPRGDNQFLKRRAKRFLAHPTPDPEFRGRCQSMDDGFDILLSRLRMKIERKTFRGC